MPEYLAQEKVLAGAGLALLLFAGWLFTLIIGTQQHLRDKQEQLAERVAYIEAQQRHQIDCKRRTDK